MGLGTVAIHAGEKPGKDEDVQGKTGGRDERGEEGREEFDL